MSEVGNPCLAGVKPPARCASCSHHPRLLPDGSCIDCGAEKAPVHVPPAAAAQRAPSPPQSGLAPAPSITDWMRQPIPGGALAPTKSRDEPTEPTHAGAPPAGSAQSRGARGRARQPDAELPQAKRPRMQARGRQGAPRKPARAPPQGEAEKSAAHLTVTEEPVNLAALKDFASRRAADTLVLPGCAATVRECIFYFLKCARWVSDELGVLTVLWHEANTFEEHGIATRRYSGLREGDEDSTPAALKALVAAGVPSVFVGRSLFGLPKMLKYLARTGLSACDIDQTNAHFQCQLSRHPNARELGKYVKDRQRLVCHHPWQMWYLRFQRSLGCQCPRRFSNRYPLRLPWGSTIPFGTSRVLSQAPRP